MTATVTDLFCGAGGSSLGAEAAGMQLVMAANHWDQAIDVHQFHFPNAKHDLADISQADPRRYPVTNVLLASPECTNHSQARGRSRKAEPIDGDPAAERSRATMWCVVQFAEQIGYDAIVVENVVEVVKWGPKNNPGAMWRLWLKAMTEGLGYEYRILSHNSMHHGVAQSRDRVYIVFTRPGLKVDLEMEHSAFCPKCSGHTVARQTWRPKAAEREFVLGRYGQRNQWTWNCVTCHTIVEPATIGAREIIDWSGPCPRIGDRTGTDMLVPNTRARILAGLQRYGWAPITTTGAGNTHERTPGNRARTLDQPLPVQQTTGTSALATPPNLIVRSNGNTGNTLGRFTSTIDDPAPTMVTTQRPALVMPMRAHGHSYPATQPIGAVTAGGNHHALLMRNNPGGAEMVTPAEEPARTLTTKGHQSLLVPDLGPWDELDVLAELERIIDDCGFRMLEPWEVAAAMAFPLGYIPRTLSKAVQVKLAGNAVTPPVMQWICGRILQALEVAA